MSEKKRVLYWRRSLEVSSEPDYGNIMRGPVVVAVAMLECGHERTFPKNFYGLHGIAWCTVCEPTRLRD